MIFDGFYYGKSPLNHHLGNMNMCFFHAPNKQSKCLEEDSEKMKVQTTGFVQNCECLFFLELLMVEAEQNALKWLSKYHLHQERAVFFVSKQGFPHGFGTIVLLSMPSPLFRSHVSFCWCLEHRVIVFVVATGTVDSSPKRKGGGSLNITLQLGKCSKFDEHV